MHQIILYEDRNGVKPVDEYLKEAGFAEHKRRQNPPGKDPRVR